MGVEAGVRDADELSVETFFAAAGFVAGNEEDGFSSGVEREGNAPLAAVGTKAEFFHVGVAGAVQRVGMGAAQLRAELVE